MKNDGDVAAGSRMQRDTKIFRHAVVKNISRPDPDIVHSLGVAGVATVHGAQGRIGLLRPYMRPIHPTAKIAGPAVTVLSRPGDNLMINAAIEVCKRGDVLVVAITSESTDGMFGDMLGTLCVTLGIAGLIIDAGVRDVVGLNEMNFPVWAKAVSAQGCSKVLAGSVNIPVVCAGELVRPGDVIVADPDGVCVVRKEMAREVNEAAQEKLREEAHDRALYESGTLSIDLGGKREKLVELGVEYIEEEPEYFG
jgi:4-hydroxy-4-methyl-2-oxoglutarate aldolase